MKPLTKKSPDFLKNQIYQHIKQYGPITASEIADRIPILSHDPIRVIRQKIRELILIDKIPIASSMSEPMGYFIATQDATSQQYVRQLKSRIMKIAQRLAAFESSTAKQIQLILFSESEVKK